MTRLRPWLLVAFVTCLFASACTSKDDKGDAAGPTPTSDGAMPKLDSASPPPIGDAGNKAEAGDVRLALDAAGPIPDVGFDSIGLADVPVDAAAIDAPVGSDGNAIRQDAPGDSTGSADAVAGTADAGPVSAVCPTATSTAPAGAVASTVAGGLWYDSATWVGGVVPGPTQDAIVNGEVQVNAAADKTIATCRTMFVSATGVVRGAAYTAAVLVVNGDFLNQGAVRNGPPYASYDTASLEVRIGGSFYQGNSYGVVGTHFIGNQEQFIAVADGKTLNGAFVDDNSASPLAGCSPISANALTLTLGTAAGQGSFDMQTNALTLAAGDVKITNGILHASRIVGVAGATFTCDRIAANGTLTLEGDIPTNTLTIDGNVKVAAAAALYNQGYTEPTLTINGNLENLGTLRRGPGFAAYGEGNLTVNLSGNLIQNGQYTPTATNLTGTASQTIAVGAGKILTGTFKDTTPGSAIVAGSDITASSLAFDLGAATGSFDMQTYALTLAAGDVKISNGILRASRIVGVAGATFTCDRIATSSTLTLEGDVRTNNLTVDGNVKVAATGILYNQSYTEAILTINGNLENLGTLRRGPGVAAYGEGNLTVNLTGDLIQNGSYTPLATNLTGTTSQTITVGAGKILTGSFKDTTPASPIVAGSDFTTSSLAFDLGTVTVATDPTSTLEMGSYKIVHTAGDLGISTGTLEVDDITGSADSSATFTIASIVPPSGTLKISKRFPTASMKVTGNLAVQAGAVVHNKGYVQAYLTVTGTVSGPGILGSGPGFASYDTGLLYLNGALLPAW